MLNIFPKTEIVMFRQASGNFAVLETTMLKRLGPSQKIQFTKAKSVWETQEDLEPG